MTAPNFDPRIVAAFAVLISGSPVAEDILDQLDDPYRTIAGRVGGDRNGRSATDIFTEQIATLPDGAALLDAVLAADPTAPIPEPTKPRFTFLTVDELRSRPAPTWLIEDVMVTGTISVLAGPSASLKSFAALDQALCIATGRPWQGHAVQQGPVVYVSAEGSAGLAKRVQAWELVNNTTAPDAFRILADAPQLLDPNDLVALSEGLGSLPFTPVHIVVDTLARVMVGGDENSARDMGIVVGGIDALRRRLACHVQIVHHTGKSNGSIRGSSALPGALDTIIEAQRDGPYLTLTCSKQKDSAEFAPMRFETQVVVLNDDGETSLVIQSTISTNRIIPSHRQVGTILFCTFGDAGATNTSWKKQCAEEGLSRTSYFEAKRTLIERGLVTVERAGDGKKDDVYHATEKLSPESTKPVQRSVLYLANPHSTKVQESLHSRTLGLSVLDGVQPPEPGSSGDISDADLFGSRPQAEA
jgi:AAA domain